LDPSEDQIDYKSPALTTAKPQLPIAIPGPIQTGKIPPIVNPNSDLPKHLESVLTIGAKADLGIKNNVPSRTQSVRLIAPRNYLLNSPGYGYLDYGCLLWNGEMRIGRSSSCSGYERSNSLP